MDPFKINYGTAQFQAKTVQCLIHSALYSEQYTVYRLHVNI